MNYRPREECSSIVNGAEIEKRVDFWCTKKTEGQKRYQKGKKLNLCADNFETVACNDYEHRKAMEGETP